MKRGEIYLANLNPRAGTESGKIRPVLVFQEQVLLDVKHPSTIVIPLTTDILNDAEPLRILVKRQGKMKKDSDLLIDQIRAIDNKRLKEKAIAKLSPTALSRINSAVIEVLGIA